MVPSSKRVHRSGRPYLALVGASAVLAGIAIGEVGSRWLSPHVPSPLDAVGQVVIDRLPGSAITAAVGLLGGAGRGVLGVALLLGAIASGYGMARIAESNLDWALGCVGALSGLVLAAMLQRPMAAVAGSVVVVGASFLVTSTVLAWGRAPGSLDPSNQGSAPTPVDPPVPRRTLLRAIGLLSVATVGLVRVQAWSDGPRAAVPSARDFRPEAATFLPPVRRSQDLHSSIRGVSPVITPIEDFFRIDTALEIPRVDVEGWSLRVQGQVERPLELSYDQLLALPLVEIDVTIVCVSNEVGGDLVGNARWLGVPLNELLERAGPTASAEQVLGRSIDGFTAGFPRTVLQDNAGAVVAVGMNGEVLPPRHGFPARLVVPGLFGYVSATKWLSEIQLTTWNDVDGYWVSRGWSKEAPVKTSARIDVPRRFAEVPAGITTVAGVAWAPRVGISRVDVTVDDELVTRARLHPSLSDDSWTQWSAQVEIPPGHHWLSVRATDSRGVEQADVAIPPQPDGAEGLHRLPVFGR